jgi:hypothetical protein
MAKLALTYGKIGKYDGADYVGPVVLSAIPGKGRGLRATADVSEAMLLLVSEAYFRSEVIRTILDSPGRTTEFYRLDSGDIPQETLSDGIIDMERIDTICSINRFIMINEFGDPIRDLEKPSVGIWIFPSFINHSCDEDTLRVFYGDVVKSIRAGEEIVIDYLPKQFDATVRYCKRPKLRFKFECALCLEDEAVPPEIMALKWHTRHESDKFSGTTSYSATSGSLLTNYGISPSPCDASPETRRNGRERRKSATVAFSLASSSFASPPNAPQGRDNGTAHDRFPASDDFTRRSNWRICRRAGLWGEESWTPVE